MDDFIILTKTKEECICLKNIIIDFLHNNLQLELNAKSRYYPDKMGVNFCGYRIFPTHKLLRLDSKKKIKRKIKNWNKQHFNNQLDYVHSIQSINSWLGHTSHCNAHNLEHKVLNSCNFLYTQNTYSTIENNLIYDIEHYKFNLE